MDNFNWGNFGGGALQVPAQQTQAPAARPQSKGFFSRMADGFLAAPKFFGSTIGSLPGEIGGEFKQLSGNSATRAAGKQEEQMALKHTLGGATSAGDALKRTAGNAVNMGLMFLGPEASGSSGIVGNTLKGAATGAAFGASGAAGQGGNLGDIVHGAELGGVTGGAISGTLSGLGKVVGKAASKVAANAAAKTAQASAEELAPYAGVAKGNNIAGLVDFFKNKLGVDVSPETVQNATNVLTGRDGFINGTKQQLIAQSGPVEVGGIGDSVKQAINSPENVGVLGDAGSKGTAGNNLYNTLNTKIGSMYGSGGPMTMADGTIGISHVSPEAVFNEIQQTEAQINNLRRAEAGTVGAANRNVLTAYRNALADKLSNNAGLTDAISNYTVPPEDVAAFHAAVEKAGLPPSVAEYGIKSLNDAKNLGDIRGAEAPLVQGNQIAQQATKHAQGTGYIQDVNRAAGVPQEGDILGRNGYQNARLGMFAARGGPTAAIAAPILAARAGAKLLSSDAVAGGINALGNAAGKAADTLPGRIGSKLVIPAAVAGSGAEQPGGQGQPTADQAASQPQGEKLYSGKSPLQFNSQTGKIEEQPQGNDTQNSLGVSSQDIFKAMQDDLATNGGKNLSKLNTLYSIVKSEEKAQQPPKLTQTGVNQLDSTQRALKGIDTISQAFNSTTGTGEGVLSKIIGSQPFGVGIPGGGNVRNVNAALAASLPDISKALGGSGSQAEVKALALSLPSTQDTTKNAQAKLDKLRQQIQQYAGQYFNNQSNFQGNGDQNDQLTQVLSALGATQ